MDNTKYIGMDVHKESISIAVLNSSGKLVMESVIETKTITILSLSRTPRKSASHLRRRHMGRMVVRPPEAACHRNRGVRSPKECPAKARQQDRPNRCAETGRTFARRLTPLGLPRRARGPNSEGVGALLSDHQQRPGPGHDSREGALPELGHSLRRSESLCTTPSFGVADQDQRTGCPPARRIFLPATRCPAVLAPGGAAGIVERERETQCSEIAPPDPRHRRDPRCHAIALVQTPHRFRTKRQFWSYCGFGIEAHSSGEHRYVDGQLRRTKKPDRFGVSTKITTTISNTSSRVQPS